jgi:hypothetical protein
LPRVLFEEARIAEHAKKFGQARVFAFLISGSLFFIYLRLWPHFGGMLVMSQLRRA